MLGWRKQVLPPQKYPVPDGSWLGSVIALYVGIFTVLFCMLGFVLLLVLILALSNWVLGSWGVMENGFVGAMLLAAWFWFVIRFCWPVLNDFGKAGLFWSKEVAYITTPQVFAIIWFRAKGMINDIFLVKRLFRGRN